jgi:DNA-directed RNA polymerase specialized sigma24 family protein
LPIANCRLKCARSIGNWQSAILSPFHFPQPPGTLSYTSLATSNSIQGILPRARKLQRPAVEAVLRAHYPRVYRIAYALCGDEIAGKLVVKTVMNQSLRALLSWRSDAQAANWFLHHTILKSRELGPPPHYQGQDPLLRRLIRPSPDYIAFLRAFRLLPHQQREAFVLFRGERLDPRQGSVAMDCSTVAAGNHMAAADKALAAIAADTFEARADALLRVYVSLTPPEELIVGDVSVLARPVSRRRFFRTMNRIFTPFVLAFIAWIIWRISRMIVI